MAVYNYFPNVPNGPDDPADDQPQMQVNTASISSLISEDHVGFGFSNGGFHNQWRMPNRTDPGPPVGKIANSTTGYAKNDTRNSLSQLIVTTGQLNNEFQLTSMDNTNFPTFGTYAAYAGGAPANFSTVGGWTFLPGPLNGGLIVQYGSFYRTSFNSGNFNDGRTGTINFPRSFPTDCFLVVASLLYNDASSPPSAGGTGTIMIDYNAGEPDLTDFTYLFRSVSGGYIGFSWYAIGN
ncbi:hypothetical protein UFOVP816_57 [uncultured Caudovirales phage]|uniref:Putative tail fiber protein gp53-like C-terminal domain-containing protein n=1 Tax=uncultured Caudovirales phage TaxID=2100421 RepID=A0A6J5NZZ4_9CAUD|nr:hypothetical protein UFOVP816_57 [uncultured Caudovirales phage]